jgi:hypothetical protein
MMIVDSVIQFAIDYIGWDRLGDAGFRDKETLTQYLAYQLLYGNLQWVLNDKMEVTGILIAYECDEEEAYKKFEWKEPIGKNCIFVAQVAAKDPESTKVLAYGFLDRFKDKKTTICVRRGSYTTMKAHDIAERMASTLGGSN